MQSIHAPREERRRHYNVGIDRPERNREAIREHVTPALRLATWILIANHDGSFHLVKKRFELIVRRTTHNEADATFFQVLVDIDKSLVEKRIVPQIRVGIIRDRREIRHYGQGEFVGDFDRNIQRGIVDATLRTLHPVHDALGPLRGLTTATHENSRVIRDGLQRLWQDQRDFGGHGRQSC